MVKHGKMPFLECSSVGDRRFSAFYAKVRGKTIEQHYQEAKIFEEGVDLAWRERKGLKAVNSDECNRLYSALWDEYMADHPRLLEILLAVSGVSDRFGKPGHVCQATELWRIRNEYLNKLG